MRKKYSKSGAKLPIKRPVNENQRFGKKVNGNMIAGCENVNGTLCYSLLFVTIIPNAKINKGSQVRYVEFCVQKADNSEKNNHP
jgi:hypothetical protein